MGPPTERESLGQSPGVPVVGAPPPPHPPPSSWSPWHATAQVAGGGGGRGDPALAGAHLHVQRGPDRLERAGRRGRRRRRPGAGPRGRRRGAALHGHGAHGWVWRPQPRVESLHGRRSSRWRRGPCQGARAGAGSGRSSGPRKAASSAAAADGRDGGVAGFQGCIKCTNARPGRRPPKSLGVEVSSPGPPPAQPPRRRLRPRRVRRCAAGAARLRAVVRRRGRPSLGRPPEDPGDEDERWPRALGGKAHAASRSGSTSSASPSPLSPGRTPPNGQRTNDDARNGGTLTSRARRAAARARSAASRKAVAVWARLAATSSASSPRTACRGRHGTSARSRRSSHTGRVASTTARTAAGLCSSSSRRFRHALRPISAHSARFCQAAVRTGARARTRASVSPGFLAAARRRPRAYRSRAPRARAGPAA